MQPIRVLYINGGIMNRGGIESYMMNYYRLIDKTKIQIDFIVHGFESGFYDDEIRRMGGEIYNIPVKSKDYFGNIKSIKSIIHTGKYKIVHSHMDAMSMVVLKQAKKYGVPIRIAHSHNTNHLTNNKIKFLINEYARLNLNRYVTHRFACSKVAAKWLFGEKYLNDDKVFIAKNAIDMKKYEFDPRIRYKIRKEMNIEDKFAIGHIGRFDYQKNHSFLIDVFDQIVRLNKKSILILIGSGHLQKEIEEKAEKLGLKDKIVFLGAINEVNEYLSVFDVLVLPSHFEGLPVTLIEAQANSLWTVVSDNVTKEVEITDKLKFISLKHNPNYWAKEILNYENLERHENNNSESYMEYDIYRQVKLLENFYLEEYIKHIEEK